jgi:phosphonopyruvate decarboxylase
VIKIESFLQNLQEHLNVDFYTGVPDSQLKALCDTLYREFSLGDRHVVAANEGAAVGLAAGHYIASGKPALVYLQNSGIGNILNPVASLLNEKVYGIPCVFVIGWRGEPGVKDEPQHAFQGEITLELLEVLQIKCFILSKSTSQEDFMECVTESKAILAENKCVAFVIRKDALEAEYKPEYENSNGMVRENALRIIMAEAGEQDVFVSTTGRTSRELYEIREASGQGHERDFLTVGSMGHASMIAMGIAMESPDRMVWCIDGDGAALMHLGSMVVLAKTGCRNLIHIVFNNGAHESVGGMPVAYGKADFCSLAMSAGYSACLKASNSESLMRAVSHVKEVGGPCFIEVLVAQGSRDGLGRPATTPKENISALMRCLKKEK